MALAEKMERLTIEAQTSAVDPEAQLDRIKSTQGGILKGLLEQERLAEEQREFMARGLTDPVEKASLEAIFAEERNRASDRIMAATKKHDQVIKQAVLEAMGMKPMPNTSAMQ